jgi:hypothetical protein
LLNFSRRLLFLVLLCFVRLFWLQLLRCLQRLMLLQCVLLLLIMQLSQLHLVGGLLRILLRGRGGIGCGALFVQPGRFWLSL